MPYGGRSGCDGLLRRGSYISPLRSLLSESELTASCVRSHLFGIGQHGLHEAVAVGSSLVVVLRQSRSRWLMEGVMTITPADNLDDDAHLQRCVRFVFGSQGGCMCPSNGRAP
jgi:hypothetical protein